MTSVCMATYNGERFLREQIDSILCQLGPDDELIISDDGSTDGTLGIIESYGDSRIRLLHHERKKNRFYSSLNVIYSTFNFENALLHVKGDFIFLADQDDVWELEKIKKSLKLLETYDYVLHNFSVIDENGSVLREKFYRKSPLKFNYMYDIIRPNFWGCCSCFKKNILLKVLPFPKKICLHDMWIGLVSEKIGKCFWNDEILLKHRISSQNTSTGCKKSTNSLVLKIRYRLNTLMELHKI